MRRFAPIAAVALFAAGTAMAQTQSPAPTPQGSSPAPAARTESPGTPPGTSMQRRDGTNTTGAQTAPAPATTGGGAQPAATNDRNGQPPVAGANSFTEGQARSRIEGAGYSDITGLTKDDQGVWRGRAMRQGRQVSVALDYQGNITAQ